MLFELLIGLLAINAASGPSVSLHFAQGSIPAAQTSVAECGRTASEPTDELEEEESEEGDNPCLSEAAPLGRLILTPRKSEVSSEDNGSFARMLRTKNIDALSERYNVQLNVREAPDIGLATVAPDTLLLTVLQHELINKAQKKHADLVKEEFDREFDPADLQVVREDGVTLTPTGVSRFTKVADATEDAWYADGYVLDHRYHIDLPEALDPGFEYTLKATDDRFGEIRFRPFQDVSPAIRNPRVYDLSNPRKHAKLSSFKGPGAGGISYEKGTRFSLVEEGSGTIIKQGKITLDQEANANTGANVYDIDFSDVDRAGTFRIFVEGVGVSHAFEIRTNVWKDMFVLAMQGLYNHRAFIELDGTYTDFKRPANTQLQLRQSTVSATDLEFFGEKNQFGARFERVPANLTDAPARPISEVYGGWYDAGDFDTYNRHLGVVDNLIQTFNINPRFFESTKLNLRENTDDIPDILNEALWGLSLWVNLQEADGGVPAGYEFDSHPGNTKSWEETEAFIYAPDFHTSHRFAVTASSLSLALKPYDRKKARDLAERAKKAFDWAEARYAKERHKIHQNNWHGRNLSADFRQIAAVAMFRLTREKRYHDIFMNVGTRDKNIEALAIYAGLDSKKYDVNRRHQKWARNRILELANQVVANVEDNGFDTISVPGKAQFWGINSFTTAGENMKVLAFADGLSEDPKYRTALAASMAFGLGMNPDNMSHTTGTARRGLAYDEPDDLLHTDSIHTDQQVDGVTIYGFFARNHGNWSHIHNGTGNLFYDDSKGKNAVPHMQMFNDYHFLVPIMEYTIHQTIDTQIHAWGLLAARAQD